MTLKNSARMQGFIRAVSDQNHPLQTRLSLILTDFEPNNNKQGIPYSEASNILRTALHSPLKINFDGVDIYGHKGAIPIGPIVEASKGQDNGRDVIMAEAVIWNDIYEDISDHLKVAFAEGIGTSWEIYYANSNKDDNGVEWLEGCIFAGTCVVDTPAYGPNRTRFLAIAEKLNDRADELLEKVNMANQKDDVTDVTKSDDVELADAASTADDVNNLRADISNAMELLSNLYSGFYGMLDETYELEQNLTTNDMSAVAEQFQKLVAGIQKRFDGLKDKVSTAEQALAELKDKTEKEQKLASRKEKLAEFGLEMAEDKQDFYLSLSEEAFDTYINDLTSVKSKSATAEKKITHVPDPITQTTVISTKDLAAIFRG